jgi:hypothetical protein
MSDNESDREETPQEHIEEQDLPCSWPDETTGRIIELWRTRPQLYDVRHKWYLNRDRKQQALSEIAAEVKITGKFI